ncbi:3-beta hydroxysteroid dehydrogenase/isomerase [Phlyctema vagabunda]|uniref:3-beta hydroxysteroid dehydrogenase/isomerase n=1 Tax=Phlyctema vagabunda TaxID=108571 RepID=A0ABR4PCR5_9HELO
MSSNKHTSELGSVLVIGGCGFLGRHIVKALLDDPTSPKVAVMSRNPTSNQFENVSYHTGDVTDYETVSSLLTKVQPRVIINTASPVAYADHEHKSDYLKVSVDGTANLLACAAEIPSVRAYVYTSSAPIIAGAGAAYYRSDETAPTLNVIRKGDPYHIAKAIADQMVLDANDPKGIRTATIRPTAMYGEGDWQMTRDVLDVLDQGQQNVFMGPNTCLMDSVYVGNVADAHLLAAHALLDGIEDPTIPKVDGEAFNITDDTPIQPFTFFRKFWTEAGDRTPIESCWIIPAWLALFMADIAELFVWALSGGKKRPHSLNKEKLEFAVYTRTYSIEKAKARLGYTPRVDMKEAVRRAVEWGLEDQRIRKAQKANPKAYSEKKKA